ncbi:hypothetical protein BESB_046760 [Besnoitia besnoiti]|uniref:CCDC81 HU domain-containing protein n=1 Tax=Besnoitia besnoiti TaxID=94643 RepID=A0A2A9MH45_BESBE|nr:hypothetical protein BESB_046760 [Besnoitia besnoiti]PFH36484.1 hypothetical protein BESB_046760 [Besnoitia besnoiti]
MLPIQGFSGCSVGCCTVRGLAEHVLGLPLQYPGVHQESQARVTQDLARTDPKRQLLLIWDAMCDFVSEQLQHGKGVTIKDFGSFVFERRLEATPPKIPELGHAPGEKEVIIPRFVVSDTLMKELTRQRPKEDIRRQHISGSIFQTKKMTAINPVSIAAGCYMRRDLVASALTAMFRAIIDLVRTNYDLEINMKFAVISIKNRALKYSFRKGIQLSAQVSPFFLVN